MSKIDKKEANRMLDVLEGKGPGGKLNHAYADGYYKLHIEKTFNMKLDKLKKLLGR